MCDFVPVWRVSTIPDVGLRCTDVKNVEKVIKKNQASQLPRDHISDSLPGVRGSVSFRQFRSKDVPLNSDHRVQPMIYTRKDQDTQHSQHDQRRPSYILLCDFDPDEDLCKDKIEDE